MNEKKEDPICFIVSIGSSKCINIPARIFMLSKLKQGDVVEVTIVKKMDTKEAKVMSLLNQKNPRLNAEHMKIFGLIAKKKANKASPFGPQT